MIIWPTKIVHRPSGLSNDKTAKKILDFFWSKLLDWFLNFDHRFDWFDNQNPKQSEQTTAEQREKKMGVEREVLSAGTGPKPTVGQKVTVHCTGYG